MTHDTLSTEVRQPHPGNLPTGPGLRLLVSQRLGADRPFSAAALAEIGQIRAHQAPAVIRQPDADETGLSADEQDIAIAQGYGAWA